MDKKQVAAALRHNREMQNERERPVCPVHRVPLESRRSGGIEILRCRVCLSNIVLKGR